MVDLLFFLEGKSLGRSWGEEARLESGVGFDEKIHDKTIHHQCECGSMLAYGRIVLRGTGDRWRSLASLS